MRMSTLRSFFSGNYNALLILLILLFIFRPFSGSMFYLGFWKIGLTATLVAAIFNCDHPPIIKKIVMFLAIPSLVLTWFDQFYLVEPVVVSFSLLTSLFIFVCTLSILRDVLLRRKVSAESLRGVVCAYFLVGFLFSYLFFVDEYMRPGTFVLNGKVIPVFPHPYYLAQMLYYSFSTLLTIGFGDIVAVKDVGQTLSILEGIIGQFYIAILVSKIVAAFGLRAEERLVRRLDHDHKK
jgi:hypothetical protein